VYFPHRGVEQLAARQAHNLEVTGSSPVPATNSTYNMIRDSSVVEQLTVNQLVVGSNPPPGAILFLKLNKKKIFLMMSLASSFLFF
jgi:hypothetical protein